MFVLRLTTRASLLTLASVALNAQAQDTPAAPAIAASAPAPAAEPATAPEAEQRQRVEVVGGRYKRTNTTETALKMPVPVKETPINVNVLTDKFIDDIGALTLGDAVKYVSSVSKSRNFSGIYDQFNIRGQFVDQANGYRLDGASYLNFFSPDFSAIESVEVLKGPVSTLYGRGLGGGVVNFLSKRPTAKPRYSAEVTFGSENFRRAEFDLSTPVGEGLGVRLTGAGESGDSFVDTVESRRTSLYGVADWTIGDTLISLQGSRQTGRGTHWRGIPVFQDADGQITVPYDLSRNTFVGETWNRWDLTFYTARLSAEHRFDNGSRLFALVSRSSLDRDIYSTVADSPIDPLTGDYDLLAVRDDGAASRSTAAEVNFSMPLRVFGLRGVVLVGVDYSNLRIPSIESEELLGTQNIFNPARGSFTEPQLPVLGFFSLSASRGAFAQVSLEPTEQLRVLLGVRYDATKGYFRDDPETFRETYDVNDTTYRLGLTYLLSPDVSIYGGVSTGFSPTETIGIGGKVLPSENARNYEVGVKGDFLDKKLALAAALFSTKRTNVPLELADSNDPFPFVSGGTQTFKGFEIDLSYGPLPGMDIYASYSYIDAEDEVGNIPLGVSRQQAGLLVSYELQDGWLKGHGVSVALQHAGRFPGTFSNDFFVRGATTAQLRVFRNAKPLSWSLSVANLTDKKYYESGEGGLARGLKFGAPRTVSFSLGLEF